MNTDDVNQCNLNHFKQFYENQLTDLTSSDEQTDESSTKNEIKTVVKPTKRSNSCIDYSNYISRFEPVKKPIPQEKNRRLGVWKPVTSFVTNLQSKIRNHSVCTRPEQMTRFERKPSIIDHFGRFNVGHPSGCHSPIADDCMEEEYDFYPDIIQSSGLLTNDDLSNEPDNSRVKYPRYMENDDLSKTCTGSSNAPVLVRLNVSGTIFHVRHSTLKRDPFVYGKMLEDAIWIAQTREYYFERDPEVFRFIHSYLRRGELHLPHGMCGPLVEKELDDWGIALGLDIQRCCLGPVMESKSKMESLQKFEHKLEPTVVRPDYWIQSYKWQLFREKVWSVIDISTRHISSHFGNYKNDKQCTPNTIFPCEYHTTSDHTADSNSRTINPHDLCRSVSHHQISHYTYPHSQQHQQGEEQQQQDTQNQPYSINNEHIPSVSNANETTKSNLPTVTSMNVSCHQEVNNCRPLWQSTSSTKRESKYITWLRRFYLIYETLIVTSAVGVFMMSTVKEFRVPFYLNISNLQNDTSLDYLHNSRIQIPMSRRTNSTQLTLPAKWLVQMDIYFSIAITIDVIIRMIFCPCFLLWLFSVSTLIDILSLIPFYCEFIFYELVYNNNDNQEAISWILRVLRVEEYIVILKVFVVLRLFRVLRRHRGTRVLLYTIRTTIADVSIIVVLILESALFFGAAIFFVDSTFPDIPKGFWWALITMSTVGYGDLVPKNTWGYIVATACIILGALLMSYTIPVLVNHFLLYYAHADQLYMVKQLHRTAKRKIRNRRMSRYLQKALFNAKTLVNATMDKKNLVMANNTNNKVQTTGPN
ncbi:unnamed protein product [Heterobilharzia americana]|nr:unnamed protein product [Heterobilharzia americana]CAH8501298.1 unnamed protein product [Heterobilharzia americana]